MSINRNTNLIKAIQPQVDRAPVSYNFDATVYAIGGGGGGANGLGGGANGIAGGGGGAGAVVSSSLSIVPNITWTIEVGGGGSSATDGEDTLVVAYNDTYSGLTTFRAQGGRKGTNSAGGNTGTGSLETTAVTQSYAAYTGGANNSGVAGGGAGVSENGGDGVPFDGNPGTGIGGAGGNGLLIIGNIAGGGGGGVTPNNTQGGEGAFGGGDGGAVGENGENATNFGAGGGGGGADTGLTSIGGFGYRGAAVIQFPGKIGTGLGEYDITVTNATSVYTGGNTIITFNSGSGTFRYTAPYPYVPGN